MQVAWAPGIGVKESSFKDFWDVELGVAYIPWSKLPSDLSLLVEGATVDEESLPEHLKGDQEKKIRFSKHCSQRKSFGYIFAAAIICLYRKLRMFIHLLLECKKFYFDYSFAPLPQKTLA